MSVVAVGTYEPVWEEAGRRIPGLDEDVTTMAVAAGLAATAAAPDARVERVVVVTQRPDVLEGGSPAVIGVGLGLGEDLPVELRVGGAADAVDALLSSPEGALVVAVDPLGPAGAAATLLGSGGAEITAAGRVGRSLPMRVQRVGAPGVHRYDDARLERDRGWHPALQRLGRDGAVVVGVGPNQGARLGSALDVEQVGAAAPLFALAALAADGKDARIVALDAARGAALELRSASRAAVAREALPIVPASAGPRPPVHAAEIPLSLPAYERAFTAKVGMVGARCACGEVSFPPRRVCLSCGEQDATTPESLPRTGEVYTAVTVHAPVPGVPGPYGLAIVALDGLPLRVLAHVTDASPAEAPIGARGRLVLRRVAVREGVSDYGYGFQPERVAAKAVA